MSEYLYLASDDWGEPWGPRKCKRVGTGRVRRTNQFLLYVIAHPPIPGELLGSPEDISELLLGSTNDADTLSFIVDIYATQSSGSEGSVDARDLVRIGTGTVHESRLQAEMQHEGA